MFLGTAGSMPTAQRAPSSLLVRRGGERLLVDCGEGTQRQLLRSSVGLVELREIFFTHYHADHFLGLPGMLKTFALRGRELPITIYGPPGLRELFSSLRRIFGRLTYEYELVELRPGDVLDRGEYALVTFACDTRRQRRRLRARRGRAARALRRGDGGRARRPVRPRARGAPARRAGHPRRRHDGHARGGARAAARRPEDRARGRHGAVAESVVEASRGADLIVHEATFCEDERERADETLHSTAADAAHVAAGADAAMLALTHLSPRYFGPDVLDEARAIFPETVVPRDFDVIEVPFPERGSPRLLKGAVAPPKRQPETTPLQVP